MLAVDKSELQAMLLFAHMTASSTFLIAKVVSALGGQVLLMSKASFFASALNFSYFSGCPSVGGW